MAQPLKPWHQVAVPREDLRKGIPLDASAFAIHLDQVIEGRAPEDYRDPARFFARTYLTKEYRRLATEVLRRLAGELVGTSPGFNLTTQFGGGKTHFLTLLYHLCRGRAGARAWAGVSELLAEAGLESVPETRVAVFIGNRFDFVAGAGREGEPRRKTPWGDLAWQLGGHALYERVREHDEKGVVPGGEVLQGVFTGEPTLILMDEVLSFIRRAREAGEPYSRLGSQFYSFLDVLTREVAGSTNTVLVVSLPLSEYEMTQEDQSEFQRLSKLLDRLSQAVVLSEQVEIAEIVRRRLFEDTGDPEEVRRTAKAYAEWVWQHRKQIPDWFPVDQAEKIFEATYPFHPTVLSVFERKWQSLPRFQRTRGILRLLALWVMHAWQRAYTEAFREPLITLGTAPLEEPGFRAAVFEQLGENRLEAAVQADIAGHEAHAVRLDREAPETIKSLRLHQKVAASIFFESSGGQVQQVATLPEVRLAVGGPGVEIGDIECALDNLVGPSGVGYYLEALGAAYRISYRPTLTKLLADRRAMVSGPQAEERLREKVREAIREAFKGGARPLQRRFFPESSADIPDAAMLQLVVLAPEHGWDSAERERTRGLIESFIRDCGGRGRTHKSGLIFAAAEGGTQLVEEARTLLALESLEDPAEQQRLRLEPDQIRELSEKKQRAEQALKARVWQAYRWVVLLEGDGSLRELDLGLLSPSTGETVATTIVARLKAEGILEDAISPDFLRRHWPPVYEEGWSTKAVRDAFYASPEFPRLLDPDVLRETIARGVREGKFGYRAKDSLRFQDPEFRREDVEFSEEAVLVLQPVAEQGDQGPSGDGRDGDESGNPEGEDWAAPRFRHLFWEGEIPPRKWTMFYTKFLSRFATRPGLWVHVKVQVEDEKGIDEATLHQVRNELEELGLDPDRLRAEMDR